MANVAPFQVISETTGQVEDVLFDAPGTEVTDLSKSSRDDPAGTASYRLRDGRRLQPQDDGTFLVAQDGEVFRRA